MFRRRRIRLIAKLVGQDNQFAVQESRTDQHSLPIESSAANQRFIVA